MRVIHVIGAAAAALLVGAGLVGCTWMHPVAHDSMPPGPLPLRFRGAAEERPLVEHPVPTSGQAGWWRSFEDRTLDQLVETALDHNEDLRVLRYRVYESDVDDDSPRENLWPRVALTGGVSRGRQAIPPSGSIELTQYTTSIAASYELDTWGRYHFRDNSAELNEVIEREELEMLAVTVACDVAETWWEIVEQDTLAELVRRQLETDEAAARLLEAAFQQGAATRLSVLQQEQQVHASRVQLPVIEVRRRQLLARLSRLLGRSHALAALPSRAVLPVPRPLEDLGIPLDLVAERPDVRREQTRVAEADERLGAAIAQRLPALQVDASAGLQAYELRQVADAFVWSVGASVNMPLFDGGLRSAEVARMHSVVARRMLMYRQVFLSAVREVEEAAALEEVERQVLAEQDAALGVASATFDEARSRYSAGLSDYLPVLTARRAVLELERARVSSLRQLLVYRVQLNRALGGQWTRAVQARSPY